MHKKKADCAVPAIQCLVNTGSRLVPPDSESPEESMSSRKLPGESGLTFGQYLNSVAGLLSADSFEILRGVLGKQSLEGATLDSASSIELISEKHGALYSVSRLVVRFGNAMKQFAVNCAFSADQQAFLQVETGLLAELRERFDLPYAPVPFISAQAPGLRLFIAEWFENHHEFHLSADAPGEHVIKIWKDDGTRKTLEGPKIPELYAGAAKILASYFDPDSFSQIHPWHHAAGDFIVDDTQNPVSLRLITVRGYRPLVAQQSDRADKMLASLHFFVNLCIRMRLDRLDGVGEPAWAGRSCLPGIVRGFIEGWETVRKDTGLPEAEEIFSLFLALSPEERTGFAEAVAGDGMVEAGESDFLAPRLPECMAELAGALEKYEF